VACVAQGRLGGTIVAARTAGDNAALAGPPAALLPMLYDLQAHLRLAGQSQLAVRKLLLV
jgi:hypothetical protein